MKVKHFTLLKIKNRNRETDKESTSKKNQVFLRAKNRSKQLFVLCKNSKIGKITCFVKRSGERYGVILKCHENIQILIA